MNAPGRTLLGRVFRAADREQQLALRAVRLGAADVARLRDRRLSALLVHASGHSSGWRQRLASAGVVRDGRVDLDRFAHLPPLTRTELAETPERFTIDDLTGRASYDNSTGGSTGEPVRIVQDVAYLRRARAMTTVFNAFTGVPLGARTLVVWGAASRDTQRHPPLSTLLRHRLKNERWLDAYRIDERTLLDWADLVDRWRPALVIGYAETLDAWARLLLDRGRRVAAPKAIISTAGVLTAEQRTVIESAFTARVFNRYGSREVSVIAAETSRHDGLVVPPLHAYVEVVDRAGRPLPAGMDGDVLVTSLSNGVMPLIRYRLGDRAAWATDPQDPVSWTVSASGAAAPLLPRAWPRLASVTGRITDHFIAADGALVHTGALRTRLYGVSGIRAYQLVQTAPQTVVVRLVADEPGDGLDETVRRRLADPLSDLLQENVELRIERVAELPPSPTGKHRHTRCLIKSGADAPSQGNTDSGVDR